MTDIEALLSKIDENEVIQVTREMVAIPSITHNEGMGMVNYLERWFKDLDIPVRIYPTGDGRANFFADYGADSGPGRFMFNGHMDIKPVVGMTVDPYAGEIRDGKLYGRGTCDMKGGLAAVMCAFKALVRTGIKPKGGITLYSDIEEEYGGYAGYLWAKDQGFFDSFEGLISCEPTELEIQIGNRGCFVTSFKTKGKSAHSGLPHLGINAIHNMAIFIDEYLKLPYLQVENEWFGKCTVNFEKIEGGLYLAAIPDSCRVCLDSRLIPDTPPELVQKQVDELMERLNREHGINISEVPEPKNWRAKGGKERAESISPGDPLTLRVADAYRHILGTEPTISGCPGVTMAMVIIRMGIPAIICGPGAVAQAHTADEYIKVDQLPKATRLYTALMAGM
ncbi:MAG: ArgE/DapE family deacylase [Candidatus Latescibacteria bacterium]|nr:ArgE/DapE family deacylase [Candidatus Latescibacterota bacterium]